MNKRTTALAKPTVFTRNWLIHKGRAPPGRAALVNYRANGEANGACTGWRRVRFRRSFWSMRTHCSLNLNRPFLFLVALSVLVSAASAQQAAIPATDPAARDLVLHAELSARTLPPGAPLFAGVQMRNVSEHEVQIADNVMSPGFQGFKVEVTTLDGQPVPMSRWGQRANLGESRTAAVTLLPGEEQDAVLEVTPAFDLTKPGNYVLTVKHGEARSAPIVFSVVEGAQPDARKAAVSDPQRDAAAALDARLAASAPMKVTGPARIGTAMLNEPLSVDITLTNRSAKPLRFGYRNWVRLEVEYPDGRTTEFFGQHGEQDWNQLLALSPIAAHSSVVFKTLVQDRFTFPTPGNYVLRFWFPRAMSAYTLPVTITGRAADAAASR